MSRDLAIADFLGRHGYGAARPTPLAADASLRRYLRLPGGPRAALLMDAPPPEDVRPFLAVGAHLASLGLSVPEVFAADEALGLLLLEDFGDAAFPTVMDEASTPVLFDAAVDVLAAMQDAPPPSLPVWNADAMAAACGTILDWWWPAAFGQAVPEEARTELASALDTMLAPLRDGPRVFVHRDYFAGNLMWLPDRTGLRRVGVLDFQSAALGHPAYDLASLVQDNRRDLQAALRARAAARLLAARPALDPEAFEAAVAICAAQRHLRVAGQWVRLARRDGKPQYLSYGSRTWRLLETAISHPAAAALAEFLHRWVPRERRGNPPEQPTWNAA